MKILLCNDDGYQAQGIVALYEALRHVADVEVIAPEFNNSAKSNALTLHSPLYVQRAANGFRYIDGTPADCVHIALTDLLPEQPDLVVSGINNGANMGDDTIYSGTVGAAMEGYLFGVPAIAFSQVARLGAYRSSGRSGQEPGAATPTASAYLQAGRRNACLVAERQYSQSAAGSDQARAPVPPGPAPCGRKRHHPAKPAR